MGANIENCSNLDLHEVGKRIRIIRESKSLTQEQLAEYANVSVSHMRHIEQGKINLSCNSLMGICKALDVSPDSILIGTSITPLSERVSSVINAALMCMEPISELREALTRLLKENP